MPHYWPATLLLGALAATAVALGGEGDQAQRLEGEKAERFTRLADAAHRKLGKPSPVKVSPDFKRVVGLRARDRGGLVVPDAKLTPAVLQNAEKQIVPLGILFTHGLTVVVADEPVPADRHRRIEVAFEGQDRTLAVLHLAATKVAGRLALLVYADAKAPVAVTTLAEAQEASEFPLDLEARPAGNARATLTLKVLGRYRAALLIAAQD